MRKRRSWVAENIDLEYRREQKMLRKMQQEEIREEEKAKEEGKKSK